jgi:hypothetical protein
MVPGLQQIGGKGKPYDQRRAIAAKLKSYYPTILAYCDMDSLVLLVLPLVLLYWQSPPFAEVLPSAVYPRLSTGDPKSQGHYLAV